MLFRSAVILKSAIFDEPFTPKLVAQSEVVRGMGNFPTLRGYVCTTPKPRAEIPLLSDKGDPILAHWQYGLGRAVAFTSDAKARWAKDWLAWGNYKQFWAQVAQWSLRRLENADFTTEVTVDRGEGHISVEAIDDKGDFRNFLTLQTAVLSPKGERVNVRLEQTGPGRYEAKFPTKEVGAYTLNIAEMKDGKAMGFQSAGASVNYSPEFNAPEPNLNLLARLAESGGGKLLEPLTSAALAAPLAPADNPFLHDRRKTFQPRDWWETLIKLAILLFVIDVAVRRIQLEREQIAKAWVAVKRTVFFWKGVPRAAEADESLAALLTRRDQVRSRQTAPAPEARPELFQPQAPVILPSRPAREDSPAMEIQSPEETGATPGAAKDQPTTTTSRLLDATRKAQRKQ